MLLGLFTLWGLFVGCIVIIWALIQRSAVRRHQEEQARQVEYQAAWQRWHAQKLAAERAWREAAERERSKQAAAERTRQEEAERVWREQIAALNTLDGLLSLTPTEFEQMVGKLLEFRGFRNVEHTGGAGDLAADLICEDADGLKVVVQCKRYAPYNLVGSPEIQKFLGMMVVHHQANMGLFITTSGYTIPALELGEQHNDRLLLIGGDGIAAMMQDFAARYGHTQ